MIIHLYFLHYFFPKCHETLDGMSSKDFLDNASKTSSGYDDEEFNDDSTNSDVEDKQKVVLPYKSKVFSREGGPAKTCVICKDIIVISDEEDDDAENDDDESDVWTVCSNSDEEYYTFCIDDFADEPERT